MNGKCKDVIRKIHSNKLYSKVSRPDSRAAYILLIKKYSYQDQDYLFRYEKWLEFREIVMERILKRHGTLTCQYCGKQHLDKDAPRNNFNLATLDHFIPLAKGGGRYDPENLIVACYPCNNKKENRLLKYQPDSLLSNYDQVKILKTFFPKQYSPLKSLTLFLSKTFKNNRTNNGVFMEHIS